MKIYHEIAAAISEQRRETDGSLSAIARFSADFTGFKGHFENQPILPGICQLELVRAVVARELGKPLVLLQVKNVKYLRVVRPEEELAVKVNVSNCADTLLIDATIKASDSLISKIKLELEIEEEEC